MKCPSCGGEATSRFCPFCGSEMPKNGPDTVNYDNSTRRTVVVNNYYQGGAEQQKTPPTSPYVQQQYVKRQQIVSDKSWTTTLLLCVLLGFFGGHMFYVGKGGMGVLYLFTCGLFGIGWIVDIIRIAVGSFKDAQGYPIKNI